MAGGVGSSASQIEGRVVGALAVVNAFGDVVDAQGNIVAGARDDGGAFVDTAAYLREGGLPKRNGSGAGTNTTLAVVATDHALTRLDLRTVARQAMNAIVRHISPANTLFDGDLVFACSTGGEPEECTPGELLRLGLCAEQVLGEALERAVRISNAGDL